MTAAYDVGVSLRRLHMPLPSRPASTSPSTVLHASLVTLLSLWLLPAGDAHAWGPLGHRLVGTLAAKQLHGDARREVARLLHGEPVPTLAGVANWADELRDHNPDLGKRTSRWHYVNLADDDCGYTPPVHCPNGDCVIAAIDTQRALLADRGQPDNVRAQALKFLVHFVGDIHQPLHAGYARDRGGNTFQLQIDGKGSNLHWLWDGGMLNASGLGEKRHLRLLQGLPHGDILDRDSASWARASCRIVLREGFYPTGPQVSPAYHAQWRPVADTQLRLAADRLAAMLNETLKTPARHR